MAWPLRRILAISASILLALVVVAATLVCYGLAAWDRPVRRAVMPMTASRSAEAVTRGAYLYNQSALCWTCHGSDGGQSAAAPQAGGREFDLTKIGPGFGHFYGSNLTPDPVTGIGMWSDGEIVRAIREGINRQGRVIFPVMAYSFYHGLSDEDALAIVAYLRSLPPVRRAVPPARPSFAAKVLIAFGAVAPEPAVAEPRRAPVRARSVEYGEYVAWHAAGCAECHTPRDPRNGKVDPARPMAGGLFPIPEEGLNVTGSNLTPDVATGIGDWTEAQFTTAVRTGVRPDGTVMLPFMPWPSYGRWSDDDLAAVWLYLRTVKPVPHAVSRGKATGAAAEATGLPRGRALYGAYCVACHGEEGEGGPLTRVPLREAVRPLEASEVAAFIDGGVPGTGMPAFGRTFAASELADLAAFVASLKDRR